MEVPPELAQKCIRTEWDSRLEQGAAEQDARLLEVLDLLVHDEASSFSVEDLFALACTCKVVWARLSASGRWLRYLGFVLTDAPASLSPLRLYAAMRAEQAHPDWERRLLTSAVQETRTERSKTKLYVSMSMEDSKAFWYKEVGKLLALTTFPTGPQAAHLTATLKILQDRHQQSTTELAAFVAEQPSCNRVLRVEAARFLTAAEADASVLATLLPDVTSCLQVVGLFNGVPVDELKSSKWKLTKAGIPMRLRRAVVLAMAELGWLQLTDTFKVTGLAKVVFKTLHLAALCKSLLKKHCQEECLVSGLKRVYLLQVILRRAKYPAQAEWDEWQELVFSPLEEVNNSQLFLVDPKWLDRAWDGSRVGQTIAKPKKRTADAVLAQDGNFVATWEMLFEGKMVTAGQVMAHIRSLLLLDFPREPVREVLQSALADLDLLKLCKLRQVILSQFQEATVDWITAALAKSDEPYVKVTLPEWAYKDKKGLVHLDSSQRRVAKTFSESTVAEYVALLEELLETKIASLSLPKERATTAAVVQITTDMHNGLRAGAPPSIPSYTRTAVWRQERVCLQELAEGETFEKLRFGISWCQAQGQGSQDLDLSTVLYDSEFNMVDHCSFEQLKITGIEHSGDIVDAPFPDGARETIEIDVKKFLEGYPTVRYIAVMIYSYTRQPLDALEDGSVFVGNPERPGTGPGGIEVVCAARLSGRHVNNLGGFLEFDRERGLQFFTCSDHTIHMSGNAATNTEGPVAKELARVVHVVNCRSSPVMRFSQLAGLYAVLTARTVCLAGGEEFVTLTQEDGESMVAFFRRVDAAIAHAPVRIGQLSDVPLERSEACSQLIVLGGDGFSWEDTAAGCGTFSSEPGALTVVNIREPLVRREEKKFVTSSVTLLTGTECLEELLQ